MYYVIQFGESSTELIRAVAGDVDCSSEALWFGQTSPSPYLPFLWEHYNQISSPFKNSSLEHFAHKWGSLRETLGKTVNCFPSPTTLPWTHLVMSQAQHWLMASLCSAWIQTRPGPYIGQVDTSMSSEVTAAQRNEGTSPRSCGSWISELELTQISGFFKLITQPNSVIKA